MTGISNYSSVNQFWKNNQTKKTEYGSAEDAIAAKVAKTHESEAKVSSWKPLSSSSALIPTVKDGLGASIGNVELSDKAKDYYSKLKDKFHDMDFIIVSKDLKGQVAKNASRYGNSSKPVVLISEEEVERMANDEAFRKKYEGIISMSKEKLLAAKSSFEASGATVKNFGMSVSSDGRTSFFATVEKANQKQHEMLVKRQEAKKEAKIKERKETQKKERKERLEKAKEDAEDINNSDKEYLEFKADSIEELIDMVSKYAFNQANAKASVESTVGTTIDFKG